MATIRSICASISVRCGQRSRNTLQHRLLSQLSRASATGWKSLKPQHYINRWSVTLRRRREHGARRVSSSPLIIRDIEISCGSERTDKKQGGHCDDIEDEA